MSPRTFGRDFWRSPTEPVEVKQEEPETKAAERVPPIEVETFDVQ